MLRYGIVTALLVLLVTACKSNVDKERALLSSLLGKEVVISDSLECRIQSTVIDYDLGDADYKIITYIDSTGCTSCSMKLFDWDKTINALLEGTDEDVAFLMIVKPKQETDEDVENILHRFIFNHPVAVDTQGSFMKANDLPDEVAYHTMLLDGDNRIVAVGNPAVNPKIREVYSRIIRGENKIDVPQLCPQPVEALGVIMPGDTIVKRFALHNASESLLTVQELVPSCDCIRAEISSDSIDPDGTAIVTVTIIPDSTQGYMRRHIDIFYNEKENPERLTLHGYISAVSPALRI